MSNDPRAKYPEELVAPMREETRQMGMTELLTAEEVETWLNDKTGTKLLLYNSVCGCAAGGARPGLGMALQNEIKPDDVASVFAGMEVDAVERARQFFPDIPGTSPAIALLKDGEMVLWMPRHAIEGRHPQEIAEELVENFNKFCVKASA